MLKRSQTILFNLYSLWLASMSFIHTIPIKDNIYTVIFEVTFEYCTIVLFVDTCKKWPAH